MVRSLFTIASLAAVLLPSAFAYPRNLPELLEKRDWRSWTDENCPEKYQQCTPETIKTRVSFDTMAPWERQAYTDAVLCLMEQPSQLDPVQYPAAINRYLDYAVIHVNRTSQVHISGYFTTWHRYFLHLYEEDLRNTCGYWGSFPYWDFASSSSNIDGDPIFNGDAYSMSGNGLPNNTGPIILGPVLQIPHGSGGGCVTTGPFANMVVTLANIDPSVLLTGAPLNASAYAYNPSCLTRDLNEFVAMTWTNSTEVTDAVHAPSAAAFELALNGIIGGSSLGIHSAAHFSIGGPMDSIHVSPQDPIWYPLHAQIDHVYWSWQMQNPDLADTLSGTMTAVNIPPSANVTLTSIEPDWGYFDSSVIQVGELISTTSGPFCYQYDTLLG
jgi:tyrosinase